MSAESKERTRRFFISYNRIDKAWAEWIAWTLEDAGVRAVIRAWDFRPGSNFVLAMDRATSETEKTILVLSEAYLQAEFTQPEWAAAFAGDPRGTARRLIPVRVAPCHPEGLLKGIIYVDLVGLSEQEAAQELLGALTERAKPTAKPSFPGERPVSRPVPFPGPAKSVQHQQALPLPEDISEGEITRALRLNNLASGLRQQGNLDAARELFEEALELTEQALGSEHPKVAARLNNLALVLADLGQHRLAYEHYRRALSISSKAFGERHPTVATVLGHLGLTLLDLRELDAAKDHMEQALEIDREVQGPRHPDVAIDLSNLALALEDLGDRPRARELLAEALSILTESLGKRHPHTVAVKARLAELA